MSKMSNCFLLCALTCCLWVSCNDPKHNLQTYQIENNWFLENEVLQLRVEKFEEDVKLVFNSKIEDKWKTIATSFKPNPNKKSATRLYDSSLSKYRYLVSETKFTNIQSVQQGRALLMEGVCNDILIRQTITIADGCFSFIVEAEFDEDKPKLEYLLSTFEYVVTAVPKFIHSPGMKFDNQEYGLAHFKGVEAANQLSAGDRSYHAPAIILQDEQNYAALVPDLNSINENRIVSPDARRDILIPRNMFSVPIEKDKYTMPTGLDLNIENGYTDHPVLTFGYIDAVIGHHIRYHRPEGVNLVRTLSKNKIRYDFDLYISANEKSEVSGYQIVSKEQWNKYGHLTFRNRPHLAMPFEEYLRVIDSITFNPINKDDLDEPLKGYKDMGSWLEWEMDGLPVGGYRSSIPFWNDVVHNSVFWNNVREAYGFYFWGEKTDDKKYTNRAHRIINLALSAPQNKYGLFATLYNANDKEWGLQFSDPPHGETHFFLRNSKSYNVTSLSKTAAHLIDYYLECEKDERIIQYLKPYANWLIASVDDRGTVPSYVIEDMTESDILRYTAHPATSLWFLSLYYLATENEKYLESAKKIAEYLEKEIIPTGKWIDFEQNFSCGQKPYAFIKDEVQHLYARGNLSIMWGAEGFKALYKATKEDKYLVEGEKCIDYLTFTQCIWDPHYVYTAFPFGGYSVDNSDTGTYLDARQADVVRPFIWYGKMLGRQDLIERGVAAARSSIVLINHPRHKANNIYRHTNIYPFGLGPENIDHEAHPQSAMRTNPSWGEGSGIFTGLAGAYSTLGGIYVNVERQMAVGVNGVRIVSNSFKNNVPEIVLESWLSGKYLAFPWNKPFTVNVKIDGIVDSIIINEEKYDVVNGNVEVLVSN